MTSLAAGLKRKSTSLMRRYAGASCCPYCTRDSLDSCCQVAHGCMWDAAAQVLLCLLNVAWSTRHPTTFIILEPAAACCVYCMEHLSCIATWFQSMNYAACPRAVATDKVLNSKVEYPQQQLARLVEDGFTHQCRVLSIPAFCNLLMQPKLECRASWIRYSGMWEKRDWQSAGPRNDDNSLSMVLSSLADCSKDEGQCVVIHLVKVLQRLLEGQFDAANAIKQLPLRCCCQPNQSVFSCTLAN